MLEPENDVRVDCHNLGLRFPFRELQRRLPDRTKLIKHPLQSEQEFQHVRLCEALLPIYRHESVDALQTERNPGMKIPGKFEGGILR